MQIQYHGHSCFSILTTDHTHILIDPYITGNSTAVITAASLTPDVILLTHGHQDHFGDTESIARRCRPLIIAAPELTGYCESLGLSPTHSMQIGGGYQFSFGYVKMTPALHSSAVTAPDGQTLYTGNPCGYLLSIEGKTIYHAGDTGLSSEMALLGERSVIHLALLPIGGNFTMDIDDAVYAARLLKAESVIPMHYNTMDVIRQDPQLFAQRLDEAGIACTLLAPEETISL